MTLTLGSLCSGYEGLGMAVAQVLDVELTWVADPDPGAAAILAHHWPTVPNLGDITAVDWTTVPPVDVLAAGFPCQPVSHAGRRAGATDERWLWDDVARAIAVLRPRLVMLENVRGLLTSPGRQPDCVCGWDHRWRRQLRHHLDHDERPDPVLADGRRTDGQAPRPECAADSTGRSAGTGGSARPRPGVRGDAALGALGGVAAVPAGGTAAVLDREEGSGGTAAADARQEVAGLDEWARYLLGAGDLGRVAEGQGPDTGTESAGHGSDRRGDCPACGRPLDDPADRPVRRAVGDVLWSLSCLGFDARWLTLRASDVGAPHRRERWFLLAWPSTDPDRERVHRPATEHRPDGREVATRDAATDPERDRWEGQRSHSRTDAERPAPTALRPRPTGDGLPAADPDRGPVRQQPVAITGGDGPAVAELDGFEWGDYAPAIDRWARVLGRPAPAPTEPGRHGRPRLSPVFVEWLMGLPLGHVTAVPGLTRNQQLRALGNGVVPQQGAAALIELINRMGHERFEGAAA